MTTEFEELSLKDDEKAFRKGHRYHTIVCDLERATVEFVAEDRKTESLAAYYAQLTAVCAAALTLYDMMKRHTRELEIVNVRLEHKSGGRSGTWNRSEPITTPRGGTKKISR